MTNSNKSDTRKACNLAARGFYLPVSYVTKVNFKIRITIILPFVLFRYGTWCHTKRGAQIESVPENKNKWTSETK